MAFIVWGKKSINDSFEDSRICASAIHMRNMADGSRLRKINRDRKGDKKWVKR